MSKSTLKATKAVRESLSFASAVASGSLHAEIAVAAPLGALAVGDRVDLEFLQMRLPGAAFDAPPARFDS